MKMYKFTDRNVRVHTDPDLAFLLDLHANLRDPILWEAEGEVVMSDTGKVGYFDIMVRIVDPPEWTRSSKRIDVTVRFCVLLALEAANMYLKSWPYHADNPVHTALHVFTNLEQYTPDDIRAVARQVYAEWMSVRVDETRMAMTWLVYRALILGARYNEKQHIEIDETKMNLIASDIVRTALVCLPDDTDLVRLAKEAVKL